MTTDRLVAWGDELRRVHGLLRDSLRIAREAITNGTDLTDASTTRELLLYCRGFCVAITGHHRGEGNAMFPLIVAERPELAPVIDELVRDHNMIDHLVGELEQALRPEQDTVPDAAELHRHLDGIEAVMETHFRYEERKLVDVLNGIRTEDSTGKTGDLTATDLFGPLT